MLTISFNLLLILFIIAFFAGLVDSMAGGGGLITLPALLIAGIPPHMALGTNKLQSSFGSLTAAYNYSIRYKMVEKNFIVIGILATAIGAVFGSFAAKFLSADNLKILMVVLLFCILLYLILKKDVGSTDRKKILSYPIVYILFGLLLGAYDGFLGPGTGSLWSFVFISLLGFNLKKATAHAKVMNFTSNIVALAVFSLHGEVLLYVGLAMAGGQIMGAYCGSKLVYKINIKYVKFVLIGASIASLLRLAADFI